MPSSVAAFIEPSMSPPLLGEKFNDFFVSKISKIRDNLEDMQVDAGELSFDLKDKLKPSDEVFSKFRTVTETEVEKLIKESPKASCSSDPIPTPLLCNLLPYLLLVITTIVNLSLTTGQFPKQLKSALVNPLLKKSTLDAQVFKNYRPVSNLTFLSKLIERFIAQQIIEHMTLNNLLTKFQSAYKRLHSTETALLRVQSDILDAIDRGKKVFLVLLDLSAAFDTVDHTLLLSFLEDIVGLSGDVLNIIKTYLKDRTQSVSIKNVLSNLSELVFGVPQGSVLGPLIFCIYTMP